MDTNKIDQLAAQERREYYHNWRAENRDKVKKHNQNYWRRRAEKRLAEERLQNEQKPTLTNED